MSEYIDVSLLAILQGVAEFLPISSSGHLVILQHLLDVPEALRMRLEVFLHVGTLLAVFVFYVRTLMRLILGMCSGKREAWGFVSKIVISAIPAIIVYVLFKDMIESLVGNVRLVGALLIMTGLVLMITRFLPFKKQSGGDDNEAKAVDVKRAWWMGVAQAIALLPGVSRSGMTLVAARLAQVDAKLAAEFSFLMSAPLIMGGMFLELLKGEVALGAGGWGPMVWGLVLSAVVGYWALAFLVKVLQGKWFWLFGPYCIVAGLVVVFCL